MGDTLPAVDLGRDDVAISSSGVHNCALFESGAARCWGLSEWGRLGYLGARKEHLGDALPFVEL